MNLNSVNCASAFANVGIGRCSFTPREIVGAILVSASFVITPSDAENLQAFLESEAKTPIKAIRILPIHNFVGITDSSEEPVRQTFGYGSNRTLRDGNYNWELQFVDGGLCLLTSLQALNGQKVYVIFYDAGGNLIGTKKDNGLGGIPVDDFWANKWGVADGTNPANLSLYFSFKPEYINQRLAFVQATQDANFDFDAITGLQDVNITVISATANSVKVKVADKCSGDDTFSDMFGVEIAADTGFEATSVTGSDQTVSAVAYDPTTRVYTLTFTPTRTETSILNLKDLDTMDIEGYEGVAVRVPVTLS